MPFYKLYQYQCVCPDHTCSAHEFNGSFCLSFPRAGNFRHLTYKRNLDLHSGMVLHDPDHHALCVL